MNPRVYLLYERKRYAIQFFDSIITSLLSQPSFGNTYLRETKHIQNANMNKRHSLVPEASCSQLHSVLTS
jgi:hypothetical protein